MWAIALVDGERTVVNLSTMSQIKLNVKPIEAKSDEILLTQTRSVDAYAIFSGEVTPVTLASTSTPDIANFGFRDKQEAVAKVTADAKDLFQQVIDFLERNDNEVLDLTGTAP